MRIEYHFQKHDMWLEMVRFKKELLEQHKARVEFSQNGGGKPRATQSCLQSSDVKAIVMETLQTTGMLGPQVNGHPTLQGPLSLTPYVSVERTFLYGPPGPFKQS